MKRLLLTLGLTALIGLAVGCGDDSTPTGPNLTPEGDTTTYDAVNELYVTTLTAKGTEGAIDFSSLARAKAAAISVWDVKFKNSVINTNGGVSSDGGAVHTYDLGQVDFAGVTADDTAGVDWQQDEIQHIINEWYSYNFQTHQITMTRNVYTLTDAEGDNYIKMRVDSITGGGMPPAMGTVWFTYYYNPTANSKALVGDTVVGSVDVTAANGYWGYFDFSTGTQVYPADASTSSGWDIGFNSYDLYLNGGPNGPGSVTAFPMFGELNNPASLNECAAQPAAAPMFEDYIASVFNGDINDADANWYNYNGSTHVLTSKSHVYLILSGDELYKVRIDSYYRNIDGLPVSGYYTLTWAVL